MAATDRSIETGIELDLRFANPGYNWKRPWLAIDGTLPETVNWGQESFSLSPGKHRIECGVKLIGSWGVVSREHQFDVIQNKVTNLRWFAPIVAINQGTWRELGFI